MPSLTIGSEPCPVLFSCPSSKTVADLLLSYVHIVIPGITSQRLLRLDFGTLLEDTDQLAILGLVSTGLSYIWQARAEKKVVAQYKMRAELEAMISTLRRSIDMLQVQIKCWR